MCYYLMTLIKGDNAGDENPSAETTKDFTAGSEIQEASEHQLTSPQVNTNLLIQICYFLCREKRKKHQMLLPSNPS